MSANSVYKLLWVFPRTSRAMNGRVHGQGFTGPEQVSFVNFRVNTFFPYIRPRGQDVRSGIYSSCRGLISYFCCKANIR